MFADRPVLGYGPDNFGVAYPPYRRPGSGPIFQFQSFDSAHDWVLQAAATTGTMGLLALVGLIALTAWALWRDRGPTHPISEALLVALAGYWAHGLVAVGSISVDWIPWVGLGVAARLTARPEGAAQRERSRPVPSWLPTAAVVASAAFAALSILPLAASIQAASARDSADDPHALRVATAATSLDAGRAEYWRVLGDVHFRAGRWRQAADAYDEATRRVPTNAFSWQQLAKARSRLALSGVDPERYRRLALDAAQRAVDSAPNDAEPYYVMAIVALEQRDYERALRSAVTSLRLGSRFTNDGEIAAAAARGWSDGSAARQLLEEALTYRESAVIRSVLADLTR
jgi:cytochrome c-type biogenesis protein CcmH/NrfG